MEQLRVGTITPIHIKGSKSELGKYQPITVITVFINFFEVVIKNNAIILKDINYRTQYQRGFINKRSTQMTMLSTMKFTYKIYDKRNFSCSFWICVRRLTARP